MNFLVDAQLPKRFCDWLTQGGHDALHSLDLPQANRTADRAIDALGASGYVELGRDKLVCHE